MTDQLTAARVTANQTYLRRRARSAADMLLDIDPALWDEQTRRIILETLPRMAYGPDLERYGEPAPDPDRKLPCSDHPHARMPDCKPCWPAHDNG